MSTYYRCILFIYRWNEMYRFALNYSNLALKRAQLKKRSMYKNQQCTYKLMYPYYNRKRERINNNSQYYLGTNLITEKDLQWKSYKTLLKE